MLESLRADLHIHTCLSPCADLTMSPLRIVQAARARKLDVIAVCDHNSAENVQAAVNAARDMALTVLPGMEITSSEEVHVCAIFDDCGPAMALQELVYGRLGAGENDPKLFGEQIVANEFDEVEGYNTRLLIGATSLSVDQIVFEVRRLGGLVIAAHVDREAYSLLGHLGFIPDDLPLDALEISSRLGPDAARDLKIRLGGRAVITSSDAHDLDEIGRAVTRFVVERPTVDEMRRAFRHEDGRGAGLES